MPATLGELADRFGCDIQGDPSVVVECVGTLSGASINAISFLANPFYSSQLKDTQAGAVIIDEHYKEVCQTPALITDNPYALYARVAQFLHPLEVVNPSIHPTANIAIDSKISGSVAVGANAVIGSEAKIGESAIIGEGCFVGPNVTIGSYTRLAPNVVLMPGVVIGERCIIHSGVVCGSDGFGFAREDKLWIKVPQVGGVRVGDDVEIGANSTIDRGTIENTVIEDGVKLDNLVHIGHNVIIGAHTVMSALCGVAGSTIIGKRCMFGGAVVVVDHLTICDDSMFTFHCTVLQSVSKPGTYSGALSADSSKRWRRNAARFKKLDSFIKPFRKDP